MWNQGGSGDDVERAHPGHVVSILTPTSRYAEPFLRWLIAEPGERRDLCIVNGPGSFGRQVTDGAETIAQQLGIPAVRAAAGGQIPPPGTSGEWDLFSAGVFEQDVEMVAEGAALSDPAAPCVRLSGRSTGIRERRG